MIVDVKGMKMNIEDGYERIDPLPDDPQDCVVFMRNDKVGSLLVGYPVPTEYTMPLDDAQAVTEKINHSLGKNQALVEVKNGKTKDGHRYLYSMVKTYFEEQKALQYFVYMEVEYDETSLRLEGTFQQVIDENAPLEEAKAFASGIVA